MQSSLNAVLLTVTSCLLKDLILSGRQPQVDAMRMRLMIGGLIGAGLGAIMGYFGQCSSGTCPLTSTWWRGALYGGAMGLLLATSWQRPFLK